MATKQNGGCKLRITVDGKHLVGPVTLPNTGGPTKWATVMTTVSLRAGRHVLRLMVDRGGFNLDRIDIDPIGSNNSTSKKPRYGVAEGARHWTGSTRSECGRFCPPCATPSQP